MRLLARFADYIAAFNAGDSAGYARHYAPGVVLVNGAGVETRGAQAICAFYDKVRMQMQRRIEVLGVIEGAACLSAALQSRFEVIAPDVAFAGTVLQPGDAVLLRSFALYETDDAGLFARIQAHTLSREVIRAGEPA